MVTIELYGVPRQRAGLAELTLPAGTVGEALAALEAACPGLSSLRLPDGRLAPHYLLSRDGRAFLHDPRTPLKPGDRLLLLSADAGG